MNLSFVTIGDEDFFKSIQVSVRQAHRFYPDASFYIYDWGLREEQREQLQRAENVAEIIDWTDHVKVQSIDRLALLRRVKSYFYRFLRGRNYASIEEIEESREREQSYAQKPFCLLDCLRRCRSRLIYLDGDAFLVNRIDDLLNQTFDVGVTLRRLCEIRNRRNQCQVLNAGVLFFNGSHETSAGFLRTWIQRMETTYEYLVEQTALTRLIEEENPDIFEGFYSRGQVTLDEGKASILVVPCEKYNFNWIEEGVDTSRISVVHFKGGRHEDQRFRNLLHQIGLSEKLVSRD